MSRNKYEGQLPERWQANWIDPELPGKSDGKKPGAVLRKTFTVNECGESILYITCHGLYIAYLNGVRVGNHVLAPGTGDYKQRLFVQAYDVERLLVQGENELVVALGDGWYRGSVGIDGLRNYYGDDLALLCQLEINGAPVLCSDAGWEASSDGPVRENDLQQGETYDAQKETVMGWHGVLVRDYGFDNLAADTGVPVIEQERFAGTVFTASNGETIIDFGQNLAGYTEFRIQAKAGQKITIWHGETLDENGNFTQRNFDPGDRNKNGGIPQKVEYTCKDGENIYHPSFCIFGFRYAKVETDADLTNASFTAIAVYSEMPQTGWFHCGNDDVNRLFHNSLWSMRSNFVDIPTDCPTRERAGWTGDAGVFAPTAVYLCDCYPILQKWLGECRLAQREDGLVQNIAPVNNSGSMISNMLQGSAGWGDACILVPWALYQAYGNETILRENYDMMKRWIGFCENRAKKTRLGNLMNPYKKYLVDEGFHFGEWCQPDVDNGETMKKTMMHGAPEVATAYYYHSASLMEKIAEILGEEADRKHFAEIAENAKKAYRYTCTKNGKITSERQCEYVRPIAFGLLDGIEVNEAASALNDLVVKNGYHLNTGFLSTPDLCRVLADHGYIDTAYQLLLQEDCPGWLYAVKKGATTIWETWDGIREDGTVHDSLNHYSYGSIVGWLFSGVCGINMYAGKLVVKPHPSPRLGFAEARWDSPYGRIESSWKYEVQKLIVTINVPCEAEIILPDGNREQVKEGKHSYEILL